MAENLQVGINIDTTQFLQGLAKVQSEAAKVGAAVETAFSPKMKVDSTSFSASLKQAKDKATELQGELAKIITTQGKSGAAYDEAVKKLKQATEEANKLESALKEAGDSINPEKSGFGKLSESFKAGQAGAGGLGSALGGVASSLGGLINPAGLAIAGVGALTAGLKASIEIGKEFETNLQAVSAVTGVSGAALDDIGQRARGLAKDFGGSASEQLQVFQTTLSKIGPQLANDSEALTTFANNVNVLSKTDSALGAAGAVDALTGAMLQFGVDVNNSNEVAQESSRFINVLAASAAVGSASVSDVAGAIAVVGGTAKNANVSFEETNAALQVLASKSLTGSQAGTALTAVINKLQAASGPAADQLVAMGTSSQELGKLLTEQGIGAAMNKLRESMNTLGGTAEKNAFLVGLFGETGLNAASALLGGGDMLADFTAGVTGTSAATDQAAINMNTFSESMGRFTAGIEDIGISVYQKLAPILTGIVETFMSVFGTLQSVLAPVFDVLFNQLGGLFSKLGEALKPIFAAIGGTIITSLVTQITLAATALGTVVDVITSILSAIGEAAQPIIDVFKDISGATTTTTDPMETFKDILSTVVEAIQVGGKYISTFVKVLIDGLVPSIKSVVQFGVDFVKTIGQIASSIPFVSSAVASLSGAFSQSADGALDAAEANKKHIETQIEQNKQAIAQKNGTQTLVSMYKELATKQNRSAEETAKLQKIQNDLDKQYPKLIDQTKSFAQNLGGVAEIGKQSKAALEGLVKEGEALGKQLEQANKNISYAKRNVAIQDLNDQFNSLSESALSVFDSENTAKFKKQFSNARSIFVNELYGAKTADEVAKAQAKILETVNANASLIDAKKLQEIYAQITSASNATTAALLANSGKEEKAQQAVTTATAAAAKATDDKAKADKKVQSELDKQLETLKKQSEVTKDSLELTQKTREAQYLVEAKTTKLSKELREQNAKEELDLLRKQITDIQKLVSLDANGNIIKYRFEGNEQDKEKVRNYVNDLQKQLQGKLIAKAQLDFGELDGADEAQFKAVLKRLSDKDISLPLRLESAESEIAQREKQISELQSNIESASTEFAKQGLQTRLENEKNFIIELKDKYKELSDAKTDYDASQLAQRREAFLASITDEAEREIQTKIYSLEKQRDEELKNAFLTAEGKAAIEARYQKQIDALRENSNDDAQKYANDLVSILKGAFEKLPSQNDEVEKNKKALDQQKSDLEETLIAGKIKRGEYAAQIEEINNKSAENEKNRLTEFQGLVESTNQLAGEQLRKYSEDAGKNFGDLLGKIGSFSEITGETITALSTQVGASFLSLAIEGKNAWKALAKSIFQSVKAVIPSLVALILGKEFATKGFIGIASSAVLTGLLYAAVSAAESSIAGFKKGGFTGNKGTNEIAGVVHGQEFVANANITKRERPLLEHLHAGGTSKDWFAMQQKSMAQSNNDIYNMQAVGQLGMIAQRLEKVERNTMLTAKKLEVMRTIDMRVEVDDYALISNMNKNSNMKIIRGA